MYVHIGLDKMSYFIDSSEESDVMKVEKKLETKTLLNMSNTVK